jgi:ribonucleotide monophosphatase NagD (HAD superfamily)
MTTTTLPPLLNYAAYFIDLDGTVYLGKRPLPKVKETLQTLRSMGKRLLFLTNDASLRREHIALKLQKMGIAATEELSTPPSSQFVTCARFTLKRRYSSSVKVICPPNLPRRVYR